MARIVDIVSAESAEPVRAGPELPVAIAVLSETEFADLVDAAPERAPGWEQHSQRPGSGDTGAGDGR